MSASISGESSVDDGNAGADDMEQPKDIPTPKRQPDPGMREFSFPLIDGVATLRIPHPMGQENYELLKAVLEAAKSALIGSKKSDQNG